MYIFIYIDTLFFFFFFTMHFAMYGDHNVVRANYSKNAS